MTTEIEQNLCKKCGNILNEKLECSICKKKKEKRIKFYMIVILVSVLLVGGIAMFFYSKQIQDIENPIKVYEAVCEEEQDICFKGELIKTTSIGGNYSDFLRTCGCQKCTEKNTRNSITLLGFKACDDLVKAEKYMQCEEFVCSNKFIIKIEE